jgi:hypothetical protein
MQVLINNNTYITNEQNIVIWNYLDHVYTMGVLQAFMMEWYLHNTTPNVVSGFMSIFKVLPTHQCGLMML